MWIVVVCGIIGNGIHDISRLSKIKLRVITIDTKYILVKSTFIHNNNSQQTRSENEILMLPLWYQSKHLNWIFFPKDRKQGKNVYSYSTFS